MIFDELRAIKASAVSAGDSELANATWCLEEIAFAQDHYLRSFSMARQRKFYASWCELEHAELALVRLRRHFQDIDDSFSLVHLSELIERLQELFPYEVFFSPGFAVKRVSCSICRKPIKLRESCGHQYRELYNGVMCGRLIEEAEALEISIVPNPVQKYSVAFTKEGGSYNYALVEYVVQNITTPWERWSYEIEKRRRPTSDLDLSKYEMLGRNDKCPCESGKKFKRCCLDKLTEIYDHYQFSFRAVRGRMPQYVPDAYVGGVDEPTFQHQGEPESIEGKDEIRRYIACEGRWPSR